MRKPKAGTKPEKIVEMLKANPKLSAHEIAARLGVTPYYVGEKARLYGYNVRTKLKEQTKEVQILELLEYNPDLTVTDIAERVGADASYTSQIARRKGFDIPFGKKPTLPHVSFLDRDVPDNGGAS